MNNNGQKPATESDFLVGVARSIGSTLGVLAAKVNASPRNSRRRQTDRTLAGKHDSAVQKSHRRSAVGRKRKMNRQKSSK